MLGKLKRVLVAGDSYMAQDTLHRSPLADIHWSLHLGADLEVHNVARPGASNTMINLQVLQGLEQIQPDFIVIGFAFHWRLEFGVSITNCHQQIAQDSYLRTVWESYAVTVPEQIEMHRNLVIAQHAVGAASQQVPTVYMLNHLRHAANRTQVPGLIRFAQQALPVSLINRSEWAPDHPDACSFHVSDPAVHLAVAGQIRQVLFDNATRCAYN